MNDKERLDRGNWSALLARFHLLKQRQPDGDISLFYDEMFPNNTELAKWLLNGRADQAHKSRVFMCGITHSGDKWTLGGNKIRITLPHNLDKLISVDWCQLEVDEGISIGTSDTDSTYVDSEQDVDVEEEEEEEVGESNGKEVKKRRLYDYKEALVIEDIKATLTPLFESIHQKINDAIVLLKPKNPPGLKRQLQVLIRDILLDMWLEKEDFKDLIAKEKIGNRIRYSLELLSSEGTKYKEIQQVVQTIVYSSMPPRHDLSGRQYLKTVGLHRNFLQKL